MSLSSPFIHRPVVTTLLTVAIALAGAVAFTLLPVAPLPEVDFPTISVAAALSGASPEIMASSVATPLEKQFGRIAGVTEMTSASYLGTTNITLQFDLNQLEQSLGMPSSVRGTYSGTLEAFQASLSTEPMLIITALMAVYIVLGMLYESYIHPITIFDASLREGRGRSSFDAFSHGSQRDRHHRHDPADRHREEKPNFND